MNRNIVVLFCLLLPLAAVFAGGKPNFSGNWEMNASKSTFGTRNGPPDINLNIRHADPVLDVTQRVGGNSMDVKIGTDGKEYVNRTSDGMEMKTIGAWDKNAMTFATKFDTPGGPVAFKDRLWLESEGKVMKMTRHVSGPEGEQDWTLVFEKK